MRIKNLLLPPWRVFFCALLLAFAAATLLVMASDQSTAAASAAPLQITCAPDVTNIYAGQSHDVGDLTVWNDTTNLYVKYELPNNGAPYSGCTFGTLHLWAGTDFTLLPRSGGGAPIQGQFPYQFNVNGGTSHTFTIPLADLKVDVLNNGCGANLSVVAHAEVNGCTGNGIGASETGYGGDLVGTGTNRWFFYNEYTICCGTPPPPVESRCTTAFAKGGYIFTTDPKSNPEKLPSLNLSKNRWGWAINVPGTDGSYSYPIWAGAGLNKTSNGKLVGTLIVNRTGATVTVTYNLSVPMEELHIYAGDFKPQTVAPGQYGYIRYFAPKTMSHSASFTVSDTNGDGLWIIAHAVACLPVV